MSGVCWRLLGDMLTDLERHTNVPAIYERATVYECADLVFHCLHLSNLRI